MHVEYGLKINPRNLATFILLYGQGVGDKVVPVEEPPLPENIQDIKDRGALAFSTPEGGGQSALGVGGEGGINFSFLLGREDKGG
jgi:hypothetical protein